MINLRNQRFLRVFLKNCGGSKAWLNAQDLSGEKSKILAFGAEDILSLSEFVGSNPSPHSFFTCVKKLAKKIPAGYSPTFATHNVDGI